MNTLRTEYTAPVSKVVSRSSKDCPIVVGRRFQLSSARTGAFSRRQRLARFVKKRKQAIDRVQEIVLQQEPFLYLVNKNAMSAVSTALHNDHAVVLRPQVYWNIDQLTLGTEVARNR